MGNESPQNGPKEGLSEEDIKQEEQKKFHQSASALSHELGQPNIQSDERLLFEACRKNERLTEGDDFEVVAKHVCEQYGDLGDTAVSKIVATKVLDLIHERNEKVLLGDVDEDKKISLEDVADDAKIRHNLLADIKYGSNDILTPVSVVLLAETLQVSVKSLFPNTAQNAQQVETNSKL